MSAKTKNIIYWIATLWLSLGMLSSGIVQLIHFPREVVSMLHLGYKPHFLTILGVWKILGVITILLPKLPLVKEWAYAGFFFVATGAIVAHAAAGEGIREFFGPSLLTVLTFVSWFLRPESRKIASVNQ